MRSIASKPRDDGSMVMTSFWYQTSLHIVWWLCDWPCVTHTCMHAQSLQACPTLCNPLANAYQAPLFTGSFQARTLEWIAMPSSRGSAQPREPHVSCISYTAGGFFTTETPGKPNWPHIPPSKGGKSIPKIFLPASYARNDSCFPMCYPISSIATTLWAGNYNSYIFKWDNQGLQQLNKLPQITELTCG